VVRLGRRRGRGRLVGGRGRCGRRLVRWRRCGRRGRRGRFVEADQARSRVDRQTAHDQGTLGDLRAAAAKDRAEACFDLLDPERLDDVVIGATIQGPDHVRVVVACGDDDDRHLADRPKHRQNLQAINVRQPEVEEHDVRWVVDCGLQPGHATVARGDGVAQVGQRPGDRRADAVVVLDQQDARHDSTVRRAVPCRREGETVATWR